MKKRWIVLLLTVALVLGLAVFAMAAGEETQRVLGPNGEMYHCECGAKWFDREGNPTETGTCMDGCSGENLTWLPLSENLQGSEGSYTMPASGCFYLDRDITLNSAATPSVLCIDLNGNTLSRANNRVIAMDEAGDIVTITDTSKEKDGVLASLAYSAGNTGAVVNVKAGTLNLYAGTIDASSITAKPVNGGAVYVASGATFNVCGGTVKGCTTSDKGGTIYSAGTLNIKGGTITGGSATGGGNICQSGGTFTMTGGIVENGTMTSTHGGNIRVDTSAVVNLYGGVIRNGKYASTQTSNGKGANLAIVTATVTVGTKDTAMVIEGGTALNGGAAIYGNAGTLTIGSNAVITNGTTKNGNAECVLIDSNFTSATITGKPQIAEIYFQTAKSQLVASNMDPNARIGLDFGYSSTQKLSTATVDAAVAGCFYSTNGNCYIAHSGDSNIYVYVASTTPGSCICGADNRGTAHTKGCYYILDSQWTSVADAGSIGVPTSGRKVYKLTTDVTLSSALAWSAGHMVIDLNGNKLTTTAARMFTLSGSASLTITDTSVDQTGQVIYSSTSGSDGGIMNLAGTTKLYVFGGTMDASKASIGYGAIARLGGSGTFAYIHGGSILGGKTTGSGGGAFSCVGTIYMTGGSITGGAHTSSTYGGGAIHLGGGKLYMSGNATVSGGSTACSGGVILLRGTSSSTAILSMTDNASVTGGTAAKNGATVSVRLDANGTTTDTNPTQLIMSGNASITGGTATQNGGAVYINSGTTVTISGNASITGGTAVNGGAICSDKGTITMDGGTITGSTVSNQGGAVYMSGSGVSFTMNGGTIVAGNNVTSGGSAVFVGSGSFTMNNGEITAAGKTGGYGMCVCAYGGTFNLYDGTLTGGTATGSGGGALSLASGGKVYMYGGTITGGTHNNATATNGGGNVRVSSGCTMYMYGGTIEEGTSSYNGGNVFVLGTFQMTDGTISGGDSLRGGNVCVFVSSGSAGSFTMDGGTITGGTTAGTNAHGGNIHVREAGTFTMNGGTVSNGTAGTNGGNIAMISTGTKVTINGGTVSGGTAVSGSSVWVHNGTTTGNVTVSGEPSINSVYLMTGKTVTIGANGLGDKAQIGLEMQTPGAFTAENATNYATRFVPLSNSYYVVYNANKLELVLIDEYTGKVVAIVGSTPFDTAQGAVDAVTDSDNQYVKLMAAVNGGLTINKNLYLDLNGNTITGDISNEGYTLYAFDSSTDDYIVAADEKDTYGKIIGTISGKYSADFVTPAELFGHQYRYVAVNEGNNTYSFHRIHLSVKSVILYPTTTAIDYKVSLRCDEVVAKHITEFGIKAYATAYQTAEPDSAVAVSPAQYGDVMANGSVIKPYGAEGNENIFKVRIAKILNKDMDDATRELRAERFFFTACAYIKLNGNELTSVDRTNSLEEIVKQTENLIFNNSVVLNTNQKWALSQMYTTYQTLMEPWFAEIENPVIPGMVEVTKYYDDPHCLCGDETSTNNPCARAGHPNIAWEPWDGTSDITAAGNYYLTQDLGTESANYQKNMGSLAEANQPGTINLDLNGHSITSENRVFGVGTNITFNLVNSDETGGVITGKNSGDTAMGGVIFTQPSSTISLYPNVTVDGSAANVQLGGAIYTSGALNIYGATVTGADLIDVTDSYGGAVYLTGSEENPASMTVNSGRVVAGNVYNGGGAVLLNGYANLTLNGGEITAEGKTAQYGTAIRLNSKSANLYVKGGTITGGTSTGSGGGAISCAGTIEMTGGTIQNGKFTGTGHGGGNIRINAGAKMTMTGGTISGGESAYRGGNIYLLGEFEMSGGRIVDGKTNGFNGHGGNIHVRDGASFTMTEGAISGGQVLGTDSDGGNIAIIGAETQVAVSGGTISGGKSTRTGPSVWLHTGILSVSGTPVINDIYLPVDQYITISGNLSSGASIGVMRAGGEGRFTTADNATAANADYFRSTDPSMPYVCVGEEGLQLSAVNVYSVGYGAASIDPDLTDGNSYLLLGYSNQDRIATAIDDSDGNASNGYDLGLLATCLAVTDAQGDTVLLISIDAASITDSVCSAAKTKIAAATGVPTENILISAAHQHSTPVLETNYLTNYFYPGIVNAAAAAMADRATVTGINTSTVATTDTNGNPQFGFIRNISLYKDGVFQGTWSPNHDDRVYRYGEVKNGSYINYEYDGDFMQYLGGKVEYKICSTVAEAKATSGYAMCYETVIDSSMQLVKFERDTGDIIMANFQVHPHLASSYQTTVITADVVGAFRNALADSTGAKVMYFSGASGNINPTSDIGDTVYKKTADEGEDIGRAHIDYGNALAELANGATYDAVEIVDDVSVASADLSYAIKKDSLRPGYSGADMDEDGDVDLQDLYLVSKSINNAGSITDDQKTTWGFYGFFDAKYTYLRMKEYLNSDGIVDMENMKPERPLTISAYSVGSIAFVSAPYEMFCENGQQIKNGIEGLSNPYSMTFVATQANGDNGYIPSAAGYENGGYSTDITRFAAGTGEALVAEYLTLLSGLKTAN